MPDQQPNLEQQINQPSSAPPSVSPPPSYYRESFPTPPAPKSKANLIKIIAGVALVVILGAGTTLAARIWDPLWNPFRPSPDEVIVQMTEKMKEVKTLHSDGNLELNVKNGTGFGIKSNIWTDIDLRDSENLMGANGFDISFAMEGVQFSIGFETKQIEETSYMKINTIPAFPMLQSVFQMIGIDQNQLKDKWIKVDLKKLLGEAYVAKQKEETKKQEVLVEKLKKLIEESTFYSVKTELPDEEIGNKKAYHYIVVLNQNEIKRIVPEILKTLTETGSSTLPFEQVTSNLQEEMDKFFEKIGELNGELWIGKEDSLLYRFKGEKTVEMGKISEGKEGAISLKITTDFSKFNQPIEIESPKEYKNLDEILNPLMINLFTNPMIGK